MLNVEVETETVSSIVNVFTFGKGKNKKEILRSGTSKWKKNDGKKRKRREGRQEVKMENLKKNDKKLVICIQYRKSVSILYLFNITTSFYIMSLYSRFKWQK